MDAQTTWLSADWGTTNFRLRLVEKSSRRVLAVVTSPRGVAEIFHQWKTEVAPADPTPENRIIFYKDFLLARIRELEKTAGVKLENQLLVLSGMAGSTIGMTTLPYQPLPCPTDGSGLHVLRQSPDASFPFFLALVSGVCSKDDVMRGEETMLIGAVAETEMRNDESWFLFPGTHSKHIHVSGNRVQQLRTYMTGELFALLSEKSILAGSVEKTGNAPDPVAFAAGLDEGWSGELAHSLFLVRTADLLDRSGKAANYHFLSGLLLGHELRGLPDKQDLCLVGEGPLLAAYQTAVRHLLPRTIVKSVNAADALIRGQSQIAGSLPDMKI